ncbi:MAG: DUF3488 domain-containing protein [Desulfuromonadales bacterium]|nr:MAG: DUF3488 domain-containing protein [Desulfuromonadales bacterium]
MVPVRLLITILGYGVALLGYLPVAAHVDPVARLAFPLALALGILFDRKGCYPFVGIASTAVTIVAFVVYLLRLSMQNPAGPVVNFLVVLLSVRLLNEKSPRNLLQTFALALFLLASSSLFTLGAVFLLYLFLQLVLIAVALVLLTFHSVDDRLSLSRQGLRRVIGVALAMPVASVPLLVVFFTVLPRTQYPVLNFLNAPQEKATGFSERVELGTAASVGDVRTVAFRVECERLGIHDLYWRGIVLDVIDGATWIRGVRRPVERPGAVKGKTVRQIMYPEPARSSYLPALDVPTRLDGIRADQDADFIFTRRGGDGKRIRYEVQSVLTDTIPVPRGIDRSHYLSTPARVSERTAALARRLSAGAETDTVRVSRLESWFREQKLVYATRDLPLGTDPVDMFLFERRTGHCEFFASSFALLLRLAGIPARLVGGYYGGDYNELGGYYVVTEDRAHVWVEAFMEGRGWVKIDPSSFAINFSRVGEPAHRDLSRRIAALIDSLSWYWNQAVITYDFQKQVELVQSANRQFRSVKLTIDFRRILPVVGVVAALVAAVWGIASFGGRTREERLLQRFIKRIAEVYGVPRVLPSRGLRELADTVRDPAAQEFAAVYGGALYRDRRLTSDELRRLDELTKEIGRRRKSEG